MAEPPPGWSNTSNTAIYDGYDSPSVDMRRSGWSNKLRALAAFAGSPGTWRPSSATYASMIQQDGAAAHWRLNETSGTTAADRIGTAHGTITGGVTLAQPGATNDGDTAMRFNGSSGRIVVPIGAYSAFGTGPATCECWVKVAAMPNGTWMAVDCGFIWSLTGINIALDSAKLHVLVGNGSTQARVSVTYGLSLNPLAWHHVVGVLLRGSPDTLFCYIDGQLAGYQPMPSQGLSISGARDLGIGTYVGNTGPTEMFDGWIDDVALYKTALTPAQIAAHFAMPFAAARESLSDMAGVTAVPATAWTSGQYVELMDATHTYWTGTAWAVGNAA